MGGKHDPAFNFKLWFNPESQVVVMMAVMLVVIGGGGDWWW